MYPTTEQVDSADVVQLAQWYRFLPSPGCQAIRTKVRADFEAVMDHEAKIINRIVDRFKSLGGMTPAISKAIGWL